MIILDTNVLSELMRPRPSPNVIGWIAAQTGAELFTTSITEAEIFFGIELLGQGKRREQLTKIAQAIFAEDFSGRVVGFDSDAARAFARIGAQRRVLGRPMSQADAQIAAIVLVRKAKLATRDVSDFLDCGVEIVDPWHGS